MLEVLFLGTGASIPSRRRSPACTVVRAGADMVMFDCGEGSQRQMMVSPLSFMKLKGILITHLHGDHIFGLPGLLQTMGLSGRTESLVLRGPPGFTHAVETLLELFEGVRHYTLDIEDVDDGDVIGIGGLRIGCFKTVHGVPSVGFALETADRPGRFNRAKAEELGLEISDYKALRDGKAVKGVSPEDVIGDARPGFRVVYSGDTVPCDALRAAAQDADLLIHEATYRDSEAELAARYGHTTVGQAARIAKEAGCAHLALVHVSNRYDDELDEVEAEARRIFECTEVPEDLRMYRLDGNGFRSV